MIKFTIPNSLSFWDNQKFIMVLEQVVLSSNRFSTLHPISKVKISHVGPCLLRRNLGPYVGGGGVRIMVQCKFTISRRLKPLGKSVIYQLGTPLFVCKLLLSFYGCSLYVDSLLCFALFVIA